MERLENSRWGFESNCFVCEAANPAGLGLEFFADRDDEAVVAEFSLDQRFSGAPSYVHGGLVLAVLDEAMAWATIALAGSFAVTKETTTRFRAPVRVGGSYRVRAEIEAEDGDELRCRAEVTGLDGGLCATASATFVPLGPAQAVDAIGAAVDGDDARYVRNEQEGDGDRCRPGGRRPRAGDRPAQTRQLAMAPVRCARAPGGAHLPPPPALTALPGARGCRAQPPGGVR